jgi:retron-type reverse transcriptase
MNKYKLVHETRLLQQAAEVDPDLAEAVVAYSRLCADRGIAPEYYPSSPDEVRAVIDGATWIHEGMLGRNFDLDARLKCFFIRYGDELARRRVPLVFQPEDLAFRLGISIAQLNWLTYSREGRYQRFERPKASGGTRVLHAPTSKLKTVQRYITQKILLKRHPHKYATAFYPGSSLAKGASPHVDRRIVVRMDLKDFFPSITYRQVRQVFSQFGYTYRVASMLANLCCDEGRLVQGAPSSPALSNLVAMRVDQRICGMKPKLKFYYSRYADDLIFSSNDERLLGRLPFIKRILAEEGFTVNEEKLRIMRAGRQQRVTGVVVNSRLNVPRTEHRRLRAILHNIESKGWDLARSQWEAVERTPLRDELHFQNFLRGKIAFVASLNPEKGSALLDTFERLRI